MAKKVDAKRAAGKNQSRTRSRSAAERQAPTRNAQSPKYVYLFGKTKTDGNGGMKPLLGGKGAGLAEMCRIGLPVPPGCTITTEVCTYFYDHKRTYPPELKTQIQAGLASIEK